MFIHVCMWDFVCFAKSYLIHFPCFPYLNSLGKIKKIRMDELFFFKCNSLTIKPSHFFISANNHFHLWNTLKITHQTIFEFHEGKRSPMANFIRYQFHKEFICIKYSLWTSHLSSLSFTISNWKYSYKFYSRSNNHAQYSTLNIHLIASTSIIKFFEKISVFFYPKNTH